MKPVERRTVPSDVRRPVPGRMLVVTFLLALIAAITLAPSRDMKAHAQVSASPVVQLRNGAKPGALDIRASRPVALTSELRVEQQRSDGSFELVPQLDLGTMRLVAMCGGAVRSCIRVGPEGLRPVPWSGMSCSAQCQGDCDHNVCYHGRFRFVATSCDGRTRYPGPVFTLR